MEDRSSILLFRTAWVGCLLGVCATAYFIFGLLGYVRSPLLNFSTALTLLLSSVFFLVNFFAIPPQTNRVGRIIWAATLVLILTEVVLGLLPPTGRDELTHHLAIPKLYVNAGRIIQVPMAPYAYYPMLLDMLYTPWIYWGYDFVPKLIHGLFAFLTGLLLYAYLARRMSAVYGLLGSFFYLSTPAIARLSHWGYIDLGITFYTTASLLCLLRWREERDAMRWLGLAALSLGFALATKPNGLVAGLLIAVQFLLIIAHPPRRHLSALLYETLVFGGLVLLPFLPWLVKNWWQTGNPFYPLLGAWFSPASGTTSATMSFAGLGIFQKRQLLYEENVGEILLLPLRIFFAGKDDNPQFFDGVLTPFLIVFLPWAFRGKWREENNYLAAFSLLFLFYALFLVDMRIRYILSIVPPLVILAVYGVFNIYLGIKRPVYLFTALLVFAIWQGVYVWRYVQEAAPFEYLSRRETRDVYLMRMLPDYSSFQYINRSTPADARIYLLFIGRRAYYCERDYFHDGGDLPGYLLAAIHAAKDADQIAQALNKKNITHLMVREELLGKFLSHNLSPREATVWNDFAQSHLTLNFRDRGHAVYQLHG